MERYPIQTQEPRDIYWAPGAWPEEPQSVARKPVEYNDRLNYTTLPWGALRCVDLGSEYAIRARGHLNITVAGTGRLIEKYGVEDLDAVKKILNGETNDEEKQYLERLLISERIRKALFLAIANTLRVPGIGSVVSETEELRNNSTALDSLLNRIAGLRRAVDRENPIHMPFSQSRTATLAIGEALKMALPPRIRNDVPTDVTITTANVPSLLYLLHELGFADEAMSGGIFSGKPGIYLTHRGSLEEERSAIDWLRETFIEFTKTCDLVRGFDIASMWVIDEGLDDKAFSRRRSSPWAPGVSRSPYYGERATSEESLHVLYAVPWVLGSIYQRMKGSGGGIRSGQPESVARSRIVPILKPMLDTLEDVPDSPFAQFLERFGDRMKGRMKIWIAEHDEWNHQQTDSPEKIPPVVPPFLSLHEFEGLIASVSASVIENFDRIVGSRDRYAFPSS